LGKEVILTRCKDGRWLIEGYGLVWEKDLVTSLKEVVEEEDCPGW